MKNNGFLRFLSATLSVLTVVTVLASCVGKSEPEAEEDDLVEGGLNGFTLNVLSETPHYVDTPADLMYTEEANGDTMREMVYTRNAKVQKKYGLEITQTYLALDVDALPEIIKMTAAQDDAYQIATQFTYKLIPYIEQNIVFNALDLPYIRYDADYWSTDLMEAIAINGYLPTLEGIIFPGTNEDMMVTMYNTPLAADFGIENLYDVVNEGGWTFDRRMEEMEKVISDLNNDGYYNFSDRIGMLYASNNCTTYLIGAGLQFVGKDNEGNFVFDKSITEKAEATVEKASKLLTTTGYAADWLVGGDIINVMIRMIENKQVLFQDILLSIVRRFYREIKTDFGILPLVKLNEEQEYYYSTGNDGHIAIPTSNANLDKTCFALEALARESSDFTDIYFHVCLESKFTRDAESIDMIMLGYDHLITDPVYVYDFGCFGSELNSVVLHGRSYSAVLADYADAIEVDIESFSNIKVK